MKVLFDRRDAASRSGHAQRFDELLADLNRAELPRVWGEDETIGWVYQFFNSQEERQKMRDESQAPRNSRELAVRNQFFTPRYVVQFLVDNTLGRIWDEMFAETRLTSICEYLVELDEDRGHRELKDPRDFRILDPACGSGHFLLYSFDLLEEITARPGSTRCSSERPGPIVARILRVTEELDRALPTLIVEHNLHGVDIDPRAAQIAALALWLRAQRAWREAGIEAAERPAINRTGIVTAEPMPGDRRCSRSSSPDSIHRY